MLNFNLFVTVVLGVVAGIYAFKFIDLTIAILYAYVYIPLRNKYYDYMFYRDIPDDKSDKKDKK